jgi:hypothetical protein
MEPNSTESNERGSHFEDILFIIFIKMQYWKSTQGKPILEKPFYSLPSPLAFRETETYRKLRSRFSVQLLSQINFPFPTLTNGNSSPANLDVGYLTARNVPGNYKTHATASDERTDVNLNSIQWCILHGYRVSEGGEFNEAARNLDAGRF